VDESREALERREAADEGLGVPEPDEDELQLEPIVVELGRANVKDAT
jgi:hypothetical protein